MKMSTYLGDIQTQTPPFLLHQKECLEWFVEAHSFGLSKKEKELLKKRILRFSCREDKIQYRYSEVEDFTHRNWDKMKLLEFSNTSSNQFLDARMCIYKKSTENIFNRFYENDVPTQKPPAHLIHVSCTGYVSPSAAQKLVARKQWHRDTVVTHCYHMGCYGAFPAVRIGSGFLHLLDTKDQNVDIVHTELCSLHFNLSIKTIDQHVVQSLFADGHVKYSLSRSENSYIGSYFKLLSLEEQTVPGTETAMTWDLSSTSFIMTISKSVPDIILKNIRNFLKTLSQKTNETINFKKCIFAIHPGGPKIISCVEEALQLTPEQTCYSKEILKKRGNMSSATLPHVWKLILDSPPTEHTHVVSLAFGPGLTISGSIMRICRV